MESQKFDLALPREQGFQQIIAGDIYPKRQHRSIQPKYFE